jgi:HPt (histidine-containing phosphotransfer) domain-containing protein
MTAHAMEGDKQKCLEAGMNDYITKPIHPDHLFSVLGKWIKRGRRGVTPRAECAGAPPPPDEAVLPESLPGLDLPAGLDRLQGDARLYRKLLGDFAENQAGAIADIKAAIVTLDLERARRLVHTLKGTAGNLSASELEDAAKALEADIKERRLDGLDTKINALEAALEHVLESVRSLGSPPRGSEQDAVPEQEAPRLGLPELRSRLVTLSQLLAANDTDAENVAASVAEDLALHCEPDRVKRLRNEIEGFDFEQALATLNDIALGMGISLREE